MRDVLYTLWNVCCLLMTGIYIESLNIRTVISLGRVLEAVQQRSIWDKKRDDW